MFVNKIKEISLHIFGQQTAIEEISKSLWYLTTVKRSKPYVIMLYGNSSLGKTELVREIAEKFFGGKYLEKHLSMFKNNNYSEYFFGDAPNRRSLGYDLLERESNLIFLMNWINALSISFLRSIHYLIMFNLEMLLMM